MLKNKPSHVFGFLLNTKLTCVTEKQRVERKEFDNAYIIDYQHRSNSKGKLCQENLKNHHKQPSKNSDC